MIRNVIIFIFILSLHRIISQDRNEVVTIKFDQTSNENCIIDVEQSLKIKDGKKRVKKFRKEIKSNRISFFICDEKFYFFPNRFKKDTIQFDNWNTIPSKEIGYLQDKYEGLNELKHHVFKEIVLIEKISENQGIVYHDLYWCCEWESE